MAETLKVMTANGIEILMLCSRCGKIIDNKENIYTTKYCDECSREITREKTRLRVQRLRERKKTVRKNK